MALKARKVSDDEVEFLEVKEQSLYKSAYISALDKINRMLANDDQPAEYLERDELTLGLNTSRASTTGDKFTSGRIQNIDANPDYVPVKARGTKASLGVYQRLSTDPTFSEGKDKAWEALVSGFLVVQPQDKRDPAAIEQAAEINANMRKLLTPQVKYEWVTGAFDTGFSPWEIIDNVDGTIQELAYIRPDVVDSWVMDESETYLTSIHCETSDSKFDVPAEHLALYSHRQRGNNWDGVPQVREPAVFIEMKWMFLRLMGLAGEVHGLGIKTIERDAEVNQADGSSSVVDAFSNVNAEDNPVIELGPGRRFVWHSPSSGMPDFISIIELLDNQITKKTSTSGTHITSAENGSNALAETKGDETSKTGYHYGLLFADFVQRCLVTRLQRNRFGAAARPMTITYRLTNDWKDPERYKRLMAFVTSGMLNWSPTDEAMLREAEGLPDLAPDAVAAQPGARGPADPALAGLKEAMAQPANDAQSAE